MIHHQNEQEPKQEARTKNSKNKIEVTYFELEKSGDGDDIW